MEAGLPVKVAEEGKPPDRVVAAALEGSDLEAASAVLRFFRSKSRLLARLIVWVWVWLGEVGHLLLLKVMVEKKLFPLHLKVTVDFLLMSCLKPDHCVMAGWFGFLGRYLWRPERASL